LQQRGPALRRPSVLLAPKFCACAGTWTHVVRWLRCQREKGDTRRLMFPTLVIPLASGSGMST